MSTEEKNINNIIFGGAGFIGKHLVSQLKNNYIIFDIESLSINDKYCDVKKEINISIPSSGYSVIYNLAALCTIPKYEEKEYYETNILGAENVCNFAREKRINTIIFTSSIAPYGMREEERTENSLPMPTNAYGISKLVAEYIHRTWQAEKPDERCLIILRPGIVFGKGEGGNFSRLYSAMSKGLFFYPGRKDSKKASIYVKDLVRIMIEMVENAKPGVYLYNCCYPKPHSIEKICNSIADVTNVRKTNIVISAWLLQSMASIILLLGKLVGKTLMDIHPDRVEKLMISTNIIGKKLSKDYPLNFSLQEAIADWYKDCNKTSLY